MCITNSVVTVIFIIMSNKVMTVHC